MLLEQVAMVQLIVTMDCREQVAMVQLIVTMDCREQVAMVQLIVYGLGISLLSHPRTQWGISCTVDQTTVTCSQVQITFTLKLNSSHLLQQAMYLLCFALFATSILTECVSQETSGVDFSQPVLPEVYQGVIKQGFATNYR